MKPDQNLIQISGYNHERCDRNRQGGGVLPCSLLEVIAIEINPKCSKPFLSLSWYRPGDFEWIKTVHQVLEAERKKIWKY